MRNCTYRPLSLILALGLAGGLALGQTPAPASAAGQTAPQERPSPAAGPAAQRIGAASSRSQGTPVTGAGRATPAPRSADAGGQAPGAQAPGNQAANRTGAHGLARTRTLFQTADLDHDGQINQQEAARIGVQRGEFTRFDQDNSGNVDGEEFIFAYRGLVAAAGQTVEPDLQAEATRIEALRRTKAAQAQRIEQARSDLARAGQPETELERIERARLEAQRIEQARIEQARSGQPETEQQRIERARLEAQRIEQARIEQARQEAQRLEQARIDQARRQQARLDNAGQGQPNNRGEQRPAVDPNAPRPNAGSAPSRPNTAPVRPNSAPARPATPPSRP